MLAASSKSSPVPLSKKTRKKDRLGNGAKQPSNCKYNSKRDRLAGRDQCPIKKPKKPRKQKLERAASRAATDPTRSGHVASQDSRQPQAVQPGERKQKLKHKQRQQTSQDAILPSQPNNDWLQAAVLVSKKKKKRKLDILSSAGSAAELGPASPPLELPKRKKRKQREASAQHAMPVLPERPVIPPSTDAGVHQEPALQPSPASPDSAAVATALNRKHGTKRKKHKQAMGETSLVQPSQSKAAHDAAEPCQPVHHGSAVTEAEAVQSDHPAPASTTGTDVSSQEQPNAQLAADPRRNIGKPWSDEDEGELVRLVVQSAQSGLGQ